MNSITIVQQRRTCRQCDGEIKRSAESVDGMHIKCWQEVRWLAEQETWRGKSPDEIRGMYAEETG